MALEPPHGEGAAEVGEVGGRQGFAGGVARVRQLVTHHMRSKALQFPGRHLYLFVGYSAGGSTVRPVLAYTSPRGLPGTCRCPSAPVMRMKKNWLPSRNDRGSRNGVVRCTRSQLFRLPPACCDRWRTAARQHYANSGDASCISDRAWPFPALPVTGRLAAV